MFNRKKRKSVLTEEYEILMKEFSSIGDIPNAERTYSNSWISFCSVREFIKASHKVCGAYPIVFHIDECCSDMYKLVFFKEGIAYCIEVKKWKEVKT
jgi:hypothetical protein